MEKNARFILTIILIALLFACSDDQKQKIVESRTYKESAEREKTPANGTSNKESEVSNNSTSKEEESTTSGLAMNYSNASGCLSSAESDSGNSKNETANQFISSTAAVESGKDSTRKFIRTADLKFKVKSVVNATYSIENIIMKQNGFVATTNLTSNIDYKTTTSVSIDSSIETSYFTVVNEMLIRVPNTKLDTTLKSIATLIDYLDYRSIKAEDVALKVLANKLAQDRALKSGQRVKSAIDNRGKKLNETTDAERLLNNKQEEDDNAKIANLSLQDQINYSTITLSIYQRQTIKRELISNNNNINAYRPSLGSRLAGALRGGWEIFEEIIVFIAQIWGLILFGIIAYVVYRVLRTKRRE